MFVNDLVVSWCTNKKFSILCFGSFEMLSKWNGTENITLHSPCCDGVVGTIMLNLIGRKIICRNCGQGTFHDANDSFASTCFLVVITCFPVNQEYSIRFCFIMFCWLLWLFVVILWDYCHGFIPLQLQSCFCWSCYCSILKTWRKKNSLCNELLMLRVL